MHNKAYKRKRKGHAYALHTISAITGIPRFGRRPDWEAHNVAQRICSIATPTERDHNFAIAATEFTTTKTMGMVIERQGRRQYMKLYRRNPAQEG
jgi:hypothetical protein